MPSLSIIMPCHNRAHDLIKCLEAYDQQVGAGDFEIIAVDDASSDSTYQVLTSYRPSRYTLRVERLETNQGPAAARTGGLSWRLPRSCFLSAMISYRQAPWFGDIPLRTRFIIQRISLFWDALPGPKICR